MQLAREANAVLSGCSSQNAQVAVGKGDVKGILYVILLLICPFAGAITAAAKLSTIKGSTSISFVTFLRAIGGGIVAVGNLTTGKLGTERIVAGEIRPRAGGGKLGTDSIAGGRDCKHGPRGLVGGWGEGLQVGGALGSYLLRA